MSDNLTELLENEWYLVRHSGETPEIALHSAIYYLIRAKDGPQLVLSAEHLDWLRQAAMERFSEIILRDLHHVNSGTPIYRGISRSIINYRRFCIFCERQKIDSEGLRQRVAEALVVFLVIELAEVSEGKRLSIINCTYQELQMFAEELGVDLNSGFSDIATYCLSSH